MGRTAIPLARGTRAPTSAELAEELLTAFSDKYRVRVRRSHSGSDITVSKGALRGVRVYIADWSDVTEIRVEGAVPSLVPAVVLTVLVVSLPLLIRWNRAGWDEIGQEVAAFLQEKYGPRLD